jgi:cytochrome c553
MKNYFVFLALAILPSAAIAAELPDWAYPVAPQGAAASQTEKVVKVPGSDKQYTEKQIDDGFAPPDWFPGEHPAMPPIVANGAKPGAIACARCHLPTADGHPESSPMWGLSTSYMIRQMEDYAADKHTGPRKGLMIRIAKQLTPEQNRDAAEYFAKIKKGMAGYTKVVEKAIVPKSHVGEGNMRFANHEGGTEKIGERIIELPQNEEQAKSRNPKFGFISYVPPGSIQQGKKLAAGVKGKTVACNVCHGEGLKGLGEVPSLAGRDPIFLVRQLWDMKDGRRTGAWTALHAPFNHQLTTRDMIALAAYAGSLQP